MSLTAYPTPALGSGGTFYAAKSTAKDDSTISCSHLVAKTNVLAGRKKNPLKAPSVNEGYRLKFFCVMSTFLKTHVANLITHS